MQFQLHNLPIKGIRLKSLTGKLVLFQCTSSVKKKVRIISELKGGENTQTHKRFNGKAMDRESRKTVTFDYASISLLVKLEWPPRKNNKID